MLEINYNRCLTNLSNSILKYYNVKTFHNSLQILDKELSNNKPKNVILILLDGLGSEILKNNLSEQDFLCKYKREDLFSVIPTTTTAATTSIMSGLNPIEHGWLGWDIYFKDINKIVTLFTNKLKDSDEIAEPYNVAKQNLPYKDFCKLINETNNNIYTKKLFPFGENKYKTFQNAIEEVEEICKNDKENFIYVYCDNPDKVMHQTGTNSIETYDVIKDLNYNIEKLSKKIKNSLLIVVADHGHINSEPIYLTDYPDILDTLRLDISVESRACAFFVKPDKAQKFEKLFNSYFLNDFVLYTYKEVIEKKIFGEGKENKYFKDAIGDYIAFGISNKYFRSNEKCKKFVAQHAGITKEELLVPLIFKNIK